MYKYLVLGLALVLAAVAGEPLGVVTTTSDLADIARAVGGDRVVVKAICTGDRDPHFLQARPSAIMAARDADLWIRVGMDLEVGWEPPVLDGAHNPRIRVGAPGHLDASADILRLGVPTGPVSRDQGDVHPAGNPHYWLDPLNGRLVAASIAARLALLDPAGADAYRQGLLRFQRDLDTRMFGAAAVQRDGGDRLWSRLLKGELPADAAAGWFGRLAPCRGRSLLTYHRSWEYLAHRFGLRVVGELEPKPGVPPSPSHLARLIASAGENHVRAILQEPFYQRKAADSVAARTGAKVLVLANSSGGDPGASSYLAMLDQVVNALAANLGE